MIDSSSRTMAISGFDVRYARSPDISCGGAALQREARDSWKLITIQPTEITQREAKRMNTTFQKFTVGVLRPPRWNGYNDDKTHDGTHGQTGSI